MIRPLAAPPSRIGRQSPPNTITTQHQTQHVTIRGNCDPTDNHHGDPYNLILQGTEDGAELDGNGPPGVVGRQGVVTFQTHYLLDFPIFLVLLFPGCFQLSESAAEWR